MLARVGSIPIFGGYPDSGPTTTRKLANEQLLYFRIANEFYDICWGGPPLIWHLYGCLLRLANQRNGRRVRYHFLDVLASMCSVNRTTILDALAYSHGLAVKKRAEGCGCGAGPGTPTIPARARGLRGQRQTRLQLDGELATGDGSRWGHHGDFVVIFAPKFHSPGGRDLNPSFTPPRRRAFPTPAERPAA